MKLNCYDRYNKVWYMEKTRQENEVADLQEWSTSKSELNYHGWLKKIRSIIKTKHDNDVIDHKVVISIE